MTIPKETSSPSWLDYYGISWFDVALWRYKKFLYRRLPYLLDILQFVHSYDRPWVSEVVPVLQKFRFDIEVGQKFIIFWVFLFQLGSSIKSVHEDRFTASSIGMLYAMENLKPAIKISLKILREECIMLRISYYVDRRRQKCLVKSSDVWHRIVLKIFNLSLFKN